jgi:hypothetical protein
LLSGIGEYERFGEDGIGNGEVDLLLSGIGEYERFLDEDGIGDGEIDLLLSGIGEYCVVPLLCDVDIAG